MGWIDREQALSLPMANGKYDHENADEHFINGLETYREWLLGLPVVEVIHCKDCRWHSNEEMWCRRHTRVSLETGFCSWAERRKEET